MEQASPANLASPITIKWETTKRGPQVCGLPSWTWSMDYLRRPRTTPVDHSRGPLARHQIWGV